MIHFNIIVPSTHYFFRLVSYLQVSQDLEYRLAV